jgi:hypothetical protein
MESVVEDVAHNPGELMDVITDIAAFLMPHAATDEACIILGSTHLSVLKQRMTVWLRSVVGVHSW